MSMYLAPLGFAILAFIALMVLLSRLESEREAADLESRMSAERAKLFRDRHPIELYGTPDDSIWEQAPREGKDGYR